MTTIPFRGLASKGILKDPAPYQLPNDAWSDGSNVRFHGGMVSRSQIFRTVYDNLPIVPIHGYGFRSPQGTDAVFILGNNQVIYRYSGGVVTAVTPISYTPASTGYQISMCALAQVVYFNDSANVPFYFGPSSTNFTALPGWNSTWRARSIRPFQDYLIALNVTKGSTTYGNLVKWSNLALNGLPPDSWDETDTTRSAGENPLENLSSPLVDGLALRNALILYSNDEVWALEPSNDALIFTTRALFHSGGMMAVDCGAEVDGKHYVLGPNDVYVHNGVTKTSIIDGKDRDYLFNNLNRSQSGVCFVSHMPAYGAILIGYAVGASDSLVPPGNGCNKGAVYDIASATWSFVDLPNIHACTQASVTGAWTYGSAIEALTYATVGGSYWNEQSSIDTHTLFVSEALSGSITYSRLLAYDFNQKGNLAMPLCTELVYPATLARTGFTLESEEFLLRENKLVTRIYPEARVYGSTPLKFKVGTSQNPQGPYSWGDWLTFNPPAQYKLDMTSSGRFLGIQMTNAADDWDFSGFDADVQKNGLR